MLNVGIVHFWINSLKRAWPQDAVALRNEQNCKINLAWMTYWAYMNPVVAWYTLEISQNPFKIQSSPHVV